MKTQLTKIGAGLLLSAFAVNAFAAETTGTLNVLAQVVGTCTVANATLYFGTYDHTVGGGVLDANTTINVTCTAGANYSVYLNAGSGAGADITTYRVMQGSAYPGTSTNLLQYQLYIDSGYTEIWGDGTVGTFYNCGIGNGSAQGYTVYGQIPSTSGNNLAGIDTYSDTVLIEVFY